MLGGRGTADDVRGFNFDWERPDSASLWGNYTQLARELRAAFDDPTTRSTNGWEVSVCDYGSTDYRWDDTALFDANVYDQLFIMIYHLGASSANTYANQKLALTGQGADKAFTDDQLGIGVGTWGTGGPATVSLATFVAGNPNLGYDVTSITGTYNDINGVSRTGTWTIESRKQVREKTQVALDRGMTGMFTWTLHYDATNNLGLHRVMHHYTVVRRGVPDLNLDGNVNAADANKLADEMGTVPGWTGTSTAAQFDDFYLSGNWEKGDRDGNGFVNQQDADWLAGRYATLGVNLPDRLAYSGTFENFQDSRRLSGRWRAKRESGGNLRETGNFTQHDTSGLSWSGTGVGADMRSNSAVTIRNQNAAEAYDGLNTLPRAMTVDLAAPIDLGLEQKTYVTFLVRQNTGTLSASQLASTGRILSLEFLDGSGVNQFDFSFRGAQQQFAIQSQADAAGQDAAGSGFGANTTYLLVGKIAGNGLGANTLRASLFASGASVPNFASDSFPWALTAQGSAGFNPLVTQLQFTSLYEANYTVSNVWVGTASDFFALPTAAMGDFNADGVVDAADYSVWRKTFGQTGAGLAADGDGDYLVDVGDFHVWRAHFGEVVGSGGGSGIGLQPAVPEPANCIFVFSILLGVVARGRFFNRR
jgi:hypothetical protein